MTIFHYFYFLCFTLYDFLKKKKTVFVLYELFYKINDLMFVS